MSNNGWTLEWFYIDDIYTLMSGYAKHSYLLEALPTDYDNLREIMIDDGVADRDSKLIRLMRQIVKDNRPCLKCRSKFQLPEDGKDPFAWTRKPWPTGVKVRRMPRDLSDDIFVTPSDIFIPHDFGIKGHPDARDLRDRLRKITANMDLISFTGTEADGFEYCRLFRVLEHLAQTYTSNIKDQAHANMGQMARTINDTCIKPLLESSDDAAKLAAIEDYAHIVGSAVGPVSLLPSKLIIDAQRDTLSWKSAISAKNDQLTIMLGMTYENKLKLRQTYGREMNPVPGGGFGPPC